MNSTVILPEVIKEEISALPPYVQEQNETEFVCKKKDVCIYVQELLQKNAILRLDLEQLNHVLELGVEEFKNRDKHITELEEELKLMKEIEQENKLLEEQLEKEKAKVQLLQKMLFGRGTEKQPADTERQEETEYEKTKSGYVVKGTKRGAQNGHKGHGRKIPDNLPVEEEVIDLPEDKKKCEICGKPLEDTGMYEESSEISVKKIYYVKKRRRKIYKKSCACTKGPGLVKAPLPPKLIPKGKFSIEFWVDLLINKYMNHLPVTRQIFDMKLWDVEVSSGTITSGFRGYIFQIYNYSV